MEQILPFSESSRATHSRWGRAPGTRPVVRPRTMTSPPTETTQDTDSGTGIRFFRKTLLPMSMLPIVDQMSHFDSNTAAGRSDHLLLLIAIIFIYVFTLNDEL